jgi:hypothetical protein
MPENQPGFLQRMLCHPRQPPPEQLQPCRLPVPSHPSCPGAAVRAGGLQRWRGACGPPPGAGSSGQGGSRVAWGGRTQSVEKAV